METLRMNWASFPLNMKVPVVLHPLTESKILYGKFVSIPGKFDFGDKGTRDIEILIPYDKVIPAMKRLKVEMQEALTMRKMQAKLTKLEGGRLKLEDVREWKDI